MSSSQNSYTHHYSEEGFWSKLGKASGSAGRYVVEKALLLFFVLVDGETPAWAKTIVVGALGYFISPVDAIPDVIPVVGFSDDIGVLAAAISAVAAVTKPSHHERAAKEASKIFG